MTWRSTSPRTGRASTAWRGRWSASSRHVLGERVAIRPVPVIEDRNWTWHVGLDAEATAIANDLWHGEKVEQARLARILWLGVLEFADTSRVLPRARGQAGLPGAGDGRGAAGAAEAAEPRRRAAAAGRRRQAA